MGEATPDYSLLMESLPSTYLSSVVSAELHSGAIDARGQKLIHQLSSRFKGVGRIVTPNPSSWNNAGIILARIRKKEPHLYSVLRNLWNDALIAMSALQIGAVLRTRNEKHFRLIAKYKSFGYEVLK
jgi:predicted nucleic acid-binding protein